MSGWEQVYIGLGGNSPNSHQLLQKAIQSIKDLNGVRDLVYSPFYRTSPVSPIPQDFYTNAVCGFLTSLTPRLLFNNLQIIEKKYGKIAKPKNHPRPIDIDLLFFGLQEIRDSDLEIPHPRWHERLFVLIPLADLTSEIILPRKKTFNLNEYIKGFSNPNQETITLLPQVIAV